MQIITSEGNKEHSKNINKYTRFSFHFEFVELFLMIEVKTLSDVVLNVSRGNI